MNVSCSLKQTRSFWSGGAGWSWTRLSRAVLLGLLLGVLVSLPLDVLLDLPGLLRLAVQSAVMAAALSALLSHTPVEMVVEKACFAV